CQRGLHGHAPVVARSGRRLPRRPTPSHLWTVQRSPVIFFGLAKGSDAPRKEVRRAPGHARSDDPENARGTGAAARFRHRASPRATEQRGAAAERRHGIHLVDAAAAGGMDCRNVGGLGEQPEGAVLFDHEARTEAAGERDGGVAAVRRRHRPRAPAGGTEVVRVRRLATVWQRLRRTIRGAPRDLEFDAEMAEHVRLLAERYRRQGMDEEPAMLAARCQFGNAVLLQERSPGHADDARHRGMWARSAVRRPYAAQESGVLADRGDDAGPG